MRVVLSGELVTESAVQCLLRSSALTLGPDWCETDSTAQPSQPVHTQARGEASIKKVNIIQERIWQTFLLFIHSLQIWKMVILIKNMTTKETPMMCHKRDLPPPTPRHPLASVGFKIFNTLIMCPFTI